jgi:hypothetical protein
VHKICKQAATKKNTPSNTSTSNPNPSFFPSKFLPSFLPSFLQSLNFPPTFVPLLLPSFPLDLLCSYLSLLASFLSFKAISTQQSSEPTTFTLCQLPDKEGKAKNGLGGGRGGELDAGS